MQSRARDAPAFQADVRQIWDELQRLEHSGEYGNVEGGSIEQQRDKRLQLHHCANYAAALSVLRQGHPTDPTDPTNPTDPPNRRLLELGCGSGALTSAFARAMPDNWTVEATDYSESLLAGARERFEREGLVFSRLDLRSAGPDRLDGFDAILLIEVIEHLPPEEADGLLRRAYEGLPAGGMMVLTTLDRSAFPRPFSGYAPHFVEYTYRSLSGMLNDRRRNPFETYQVHRLLSERIVADSVKAEEHGGYLVNRLQRLSLGLGRRHAEFGTFHAWVQSRLFCLYSHLPERDGFDLEGYLATLDFEQTEPEKRDRDSFGLVAVLRKTAA